MQRAAKWAEHFTWAALWLRHARPAADGRWRNFALLARAVAEARGIPEIPLMFEIAVRSAYAANAVRVEQRRWTRQRQ